MTTLDLGPGSRPRPATGDIARFTVAERALHWAFAVLLLTCALTGLVLYIGPLTAAVGRRETVRFLHVWSGVAMPLPVVVAYLGGWRDAVRRDVRRLARWSWEDKRWLRTRGRQQTEAVGKFNAGQKANAAFVAGIVPVMLATGAIMRWYEPFPLSWRTGATFVHDWTAIAIWLVVAGHIAFALARPPALRSMVTGLMARAYAEDHHPRWAAGAERDPAPTESGAPQEQGDASERT
jgi:formate dehydrogenase subunit gamma